MPIGSSTLVKPSEIEWYLFLKLVQIHRGDIVDSVGTVESRFHAKLSRPTGQEDCLLEVHLSLETFICCKREKEDSIPSPLSDEEGTLSRSGGRVLDVSKIISIHSFGIFERILEQRQVDPDLSCAA